MSLVISTYREFCILSYGSFTFWSSSRVWLLGLIPFFFFWRRDLKHCPGCLPLPLIYFVCTGRSLLWAVSLWLWRGGPASGRGAWLTAVASLMERGLWAVQSQEWVWAQQMWRMGAVVPQPVESSWTRAWTHVPSVDRWISLITRPPGKSRPNSWLEWLIQHVPFCKVEFHTVGREVAWSPELLMRWSRKSGANFPSRTEISMSLWATHIELLYLCGMGFIILTNYDILKYKLLCLLLFNSDACWE